jgi:hypothetical protein
MFCRPNKTNARRKRPLIEVQTLADFCPGPLELQLRRCGNSTLPNPTLQTARRRATLAGIMWKKSLLVLPALLLLAGCAAIGTNLSAQRQLRNPENLYPVKVKFDSKQQALRWDSIEAHVMVGKDSFPMRRTHLMNNRFEALIPVPADVHSISYHYKFDYLYNDFGGPQKGSASTRGYTLQIVDQ